MQLPRFLLDEWLEQTHTAGIEFDLASSTGPVWTLQELLALEQGDPGADLDATRLFYTTAAGTQELREALAEAHAVDPGDVQIVTGASEAILMLCFLASEPGANAVVPQPGFSPYAALAQAFHVEPRSYVLRAENGWRIDLDQVRRLVDSNTRFVMVNSPHNPSGAVLADSEMDALHDFCAGRGVPFVVDEVYHPIYHDRDHRSAARLPHATILGDFSKALCLSGLRTGWIIERDARRRAQFTTARSYFTVSNTVLGERLATLAVRQREAIYTRARNVCSANLALLENCFEQHRDLVDWVRPQGGMTVFPWLRDGRDAHAFCQDLAARGVLVAPGDCFAMPAHFRVGVGTSGDRFPAAVERLSDALAAAKKTAASVV